MRTRAASPPARRSVVAADAFGAAVVAVASGVLWRSVIFASGPITSGDLLLPFRFDALLAHYASFWNPVLEFPNVETIDRLAWMAPFLALGEPVAIERAMIATAVLGSALLMYLACRRLGAPVAVACLAGVAYACNPWIANRVQHLFILPGYAVLPAVVAAWIRPPARHAVPWLVALMTVGSTTPHTTVALWGTSALLVAVRPTRAALRRFGLAAVGYGAVNLYWIVPVLAFMARADLVPSWPTWDLVELFSRHADPAAVMRLDGYWWPLAPVDAPAWTGPLGFGLAAAFLAALARPSRFTATTAFLAIACGVIGIGTAAPWWVGPLVVEGPLADRLGWLLRDPNKAVGPLAAFALLTIAGATAGGGRFRRAHVAATVALLGAYLVFAVPRVDAYVRGAYAAHPVPAAFEEAAAWLADREGRVAWTPPYFGVRTFWNGDQITSDVASLSSPLPVLSPHGYDPRARSAYLTLDFGAVLGDVPADPAALMRRWGVRWLVHHRDVLPMRLQPPGTFDNRVETRSAMLAGHGLREAATFDGVSVHDAGAAPAPGVVRPFLSARPTAAAATLSAFGAAADAAVTVDAPHPGVTRTLTLPGDEPRLLLAPDQVRVDLAGAAPYAVPAERWSRFDENDVGWWPMLAPRGGAAPSDAGAVVSTSRVGAVLEARVEVPAGDHGLWTRAYRGRDAGAVRVTVPGGGVDAVLDLVDRGAAMTWRRVGTVRADGAALEVRIENLAGSNVLAEMRLVPEAAWEAAGERLGRMEPTWAWPRPATCPTGADAGAEPVVLGAHAVLPWDGAIATDGRWRDVDAIELELDGGGAPGNVEVWTRVEGTWILIGTVHLDGTGARTAVLPVDPAAFGFAPRGAEATPSLLRVLAVEADAATRPGEVPSGEGRPGGVRQDEVRQDEVRSDEGRGGEVRRGEVRLGEVRLVREAACALEVRTEREGRFLLRTAGGAEPFRLLVDGAERTLDPARPTVLALDAGAHRLAFPDGVPRGVRAFALSREGAAGLVAAGPVGGAAGAADPAPCPDTWRLWRSDARYVDGLGGVAGGEEVTAVPVDGLLAGFWLPPGTCAAPEPRNPWRQLGTTSLAASVVAAAALVGLAALGRLP